MKIKELHQEERPREKASQHGIEALSNAELLAVLLGSGIKGSSALDIAQTILQRSEGVNALCDLTSRDLYSVHGISKVKALQLLACFELHKRVAKDKVGQLSKIYTPADIIAWLQLTYGNAMQEQILLIMLNTKHAIIRHRIIYKGGLSECIMHPREIFREAILCASASIILVHNHPSGEAAPSLADIAATKRLYDVGELMGIPLLDHIIVAKQDYVSLRECEMLG